MTSGSSRRSRGACSAGGSSRSWAGETTAQCGDALEVAQRNVAAAALGVGRVDDEIAVPDEDRPGYLVGDRSQKTDGAGT